MRGCIIHVNIMHCSQEMFVGLAVSMPHNTLNKLYPVLDWGRNIQIALETRRHENLHALIQYQGPRLLLVRAQWLRIVARESRMPAPKAIQQSSGRRRSTSTEYAARSWSLAYACATKRTHIQ